MSSDMLNQTSPLAGDLGSYHFASWNRVDGADTNSYQRTDTEDEARGKT